MRVSVRLTVFSLAMFLLGVASMEAKSLPDENESGSSNKFMITASATSICGAGNVTLTADVIGGTVTWMHNNKKYGTGNSITVNGAQAAGNWIAIHNTGGCENHISNTLVLSLTPPQPSPISGQDTICPYIANTGLIYSVTNTPGYTYTWTLPTGWTKTSGGNTNSIVVTIPSGIGGGKISVTANNACGSSTARTLTVTACTPPLPVFMAYNLGADSTLNTPALQMAYMAADSNGTPTTTSHGRVFGGRYQWGRQNLPYAISTDGNYTLYNGTTNSINIASITPSYDTNGQIIGQDNNHVCNASSTCDWRGTGTATAPDVPGQWTSLWGNGKALSVETPGSGILHTNGKYYQDPTFVMPQNNPCPTGFRLPTQNEWELMCNYDCNPTIASSIAQVHVSSGIGKTTSGLTWVAVRCGGGVCTINTSVPWSASNRGGYAVYKTSEWDAAGYTIQDLITASVQPILFLPAAGTRYYNSGTVINSGTEGVYSSSSIYDGSAHTLYFGYLNVSPHYGGFHTYGYSVRCVKE